MSRMETLAGRGTVAQRHRSADYDREPGNRESYRGLVGGAGRAATPDRVPTRSGGARHNVLSGAQFKAASQKKAR